MVKKKHYIIVTYILQMKYLFFSLSIQIVKKINRSFLFLYHVAILIKDHIDWIKFLVDFFGYRLRVRSKQDWIITRTIKSIESKKMLRQAVPIAPSVNGEGAHLWVRIGLIVSALALPGPLPNYLMTQPRYKKWNNSHWSFLIPLCQKRIYRWNF